MRALIVDRDPFRRRISRAALKLCNPMMQIAEVDRIFMAKLEYGSTFAPNFLIIDMELPGAVGYIENLLQTHESRIPQIYAYEGPNKKGVCQRLMTARYFRMNGKEDPGQVLIFDPPRQVDSNEPHIPIYPQEAQTNRDMSSYKLIVIFEWPQTNEEFCEVLRNGYKWRGHDITTTPGN